MTSHSKFTLKLATVALISCAASCGTQPKLVGPTSQAGVNANASWMSTSAPDIKRLLYVSDGNEVLVYDFATGKQVGSLSGFDNSYGQCVDRKGNVFLTSSSGSVGTVTEYAHGGDSPIRTFQTDGHPIGCSINPLDGDLAVNNGIPGGGSDVEIWSHASGHHAKRYANESDCYEMWPPGYDNRGDLYIETNSVGTLCVLRFKSAAITTVTIDHHIGAPSGVMWDGKYLAVADQEYNSSGTAIYQTKVSKGNLHVVGITNFSASCGVDISQFFIVGKRNTPGNTSQGSVVVGSNYACYYHTPEEYWHYPSGGLPFMHTKPVTNSAFGNSVSIATEGCNTFRGRPRLHITRRTC
jgi:hypothetical protein